MEIEAPVRAEMAWAERFAHRTAGMTSSIIRELLKLVEDPEIISFAGGLPAPEVFPLAAVKAATERVLGEHGELALQYGPTEGYRPLRELLVRHMRRYGIQVGCQNVLVTTGAQQALDLIGKLFIDPGDRVVVEDPTYLGALQAFGAYEARYLPLPIDDDGMRVDRLEDALRAGPKFVYVLPNFQNPSGVTLSLARRRRLVELCARHGVPVVEDDPYGQLRYAGEHQPALVRLDRELHGGGGDGRFRSGVIYVGTMSKTLAPGFRVGWVVAPEEVILRLTQMKQGSDLHSSTFAQMVAFETARGGFLDRHVRKAREVYGQRRQAMLSALERHFPPGVRWTRPEGGLFLWVSLPEEIDAQALLAPALAAKVAFVPGVAFHAGGGGAHTLRLNFSYSRPEVIEEGVRRLGLVLAAALAGH